MVKRLATDRYPNLVQTGKICLHPPTRLMHLRKIYLLVGTIQRTPLPHAPLKTSQLPFAINPRMLFLKPFK